MGTNISPLSAAFLYWLRPSARHELTTDRYGPSTWTSICSRARRAASELRSAIGVDGIAGDPPGGVGGEEGDRAADVVRLGERFSAWMPSVKSRPASVLAKFDMSVWTSRAQRR